MNWLFHRVLPVVVALLVAGAGIVPVTIAIREASAYTDQIAEAERLELALGDYQGAIDIYQQALEDSGLSAVERGSVLLKLARALHSADRSARARLLYQQLIDEYPAFASTAQRKLEELDAGTTESQHNWLSTLYENPQLQARILELISQLSAPDPRLVFQHLERMGSLALPLVRHVGSSTGDNRVALWAQLRSLCEGDASPLLDLLDDPSRATDLAHLARQTSLEEQVRFAETLGRWQGAASSADRERVDGLVKTLSEYLPDRSELMWIDPNAAEVDTRSLFDKVCAQGELAPSGLLRAWGRAEASLPDTRAAELSGRWVAFVDRYPVAIGLDFSSPRFEKHWWSPVVEELALCKDTVRAQLVEATPPFLLGTLLIEKDPDGYFARRVAELTPLPEVRMAAERLLTESRTLQSRQHQLQEYLRAPAIEPQPWWNTHSQRGDPWQEFSSLSPIYTPAQSEFVVSCCRHSNRAVRGWALRSLAKTTRAHDDIPERRLQLLESWIETWPEALAPGHLWDFPSSDNFAEAFEGFWSRGGQERQRLVSAMAHQFVSHPRRNEIHRGSATWIWTNSIEQISRRTGDGLRGPEAWSWIAQKDEAVIEFMATHMSTSLARPGDSTWNRNAKEQLDQLVAEICDATLDPRWRYNRLRLFAGMLTNIDTRSSSRRRGSRRAPPEDTVALLEPWRRQIETIVADTKLDAHARFLGLACVLGRSLEGSDLTRNPPTIIGSDRTVVAASRSLLPLLETQTPAFQEKSVTYAELLYRSVPESDLVEFIDRIAADVDPQVRRLALQPWQLDSQIYADLSAPQRAAWPLSVEQRIAIVRRLASDSDIELRFTALHALVDLEDRAGMLETMRTLKLDTRREVELLRRTARALDAMEQKPKAR